MEPLTDKIKITEELKYESLSKACSLLSQIEDRPFKEQALIIGLAVATLISGAYKDRAKRKVAINAFKKLIEVSIPIVERMEREYRDDVRAGRWPL